MLDFCGALESTLVPDEAQKKTCMQTFTLDTCTYIDNSSPVGLSVGLKNKIKYVWYKRKISYFIIFKLHSDPIQIYYKVLIFILPLPNVLGPFPCLTASGQPAPACSRQSISRLFLYPLWTRVYCHTFNGRMQYTVGISPRRTLTRRLFLKYYAYGLDKEYHSCVDKFNTQF